MTVLASAVLVRRVGEVNLVIADGLVGVVLAPGNFAQAIGDLE